MRRTHTPNSFTSVIPLRVAHLMVALASVAVLCGCNGLSGKKSNPRKDAAAFAEENYEKLAGKQAEQERIAKEQSDAPVGPDTLFSSFR